MRHYAPASIEKVLPFITQLAGAIDFARAAGVGHGGLHPRDVFVTPDEARATGFGVVEALERVGIRAPIRRPYSAPERIAGDEWSTPADVFALAAISFELLTGRRPAGTGAQIGSLGADAGPYAEVMLSVLARAMNDNPARRYGSALAFASALESAARGQSITDAVATVAAIAAVGSEPAPRTPDSVSHVPEIESRVADAAPPRPGELEVEERLDPVHAAFEDQAVATPAQLNFDEPVVESVVAPEADRFTDDFIGVQQTEAEDRRPLEASYETRKELTPVYTPAEPCVRGRAARLSTRDRRGSRTFPAGGPADCRHAGDWVARWICGRLFRPRSCRIRDAAAGGRPRRGIAHERCDRCQCATVERAGGFETADRIGRACGDCRTCDRRTGCSRTRDPSGPDDACPAGRASRHTRTTGGAIHTVPRGRDDQRPLARAHAAHSRGSSARLLRRARGADRLSGRTRRCCADLAIRVPDGRTEART